MSCNLCQLHEAGAGWTCGKQDEIVQVVCLPARLKDVVLTSVKLVPTVGP